MKRVLITGANSYIGTRVQKWLNKYPDAFEVSVLDMLDKGWRNTSFLGFDAVYHVAGIAHQKDVPDSLYEEVNYKLAVDVARKAQEDGVKQFVFMSSGAVYSQNDRRHRMIAVDENTSLRPTTPYGISKMKAEEGLFALSGDMKIAIVRPPMVYGPGAKGNYNSLRRIALRLPVFPYIDNRRSMIYIDNLCEFIRLLIMTEGAGIFLPQNKDYVNTSDLVKEIRKCHGQKTHLVKGFNWAMALLGKFVNPVNKAFGTFYYITRTNYFNESYQAIGFRESIELTENEKLEAPL